MLKSAPLFCCLALILVGCNQNKLPKTSADTVVKIHADLDSIPSDSTYEYLKRSKRILENRPDLPDSLHGQNNFYLGEYFQKMGQMDSAANYYQKATYYVGDTVDKLREFYYFNSAWVANNILGNYGDCISIAERMETQINAADSAHRQFLYYPNYYKSRTYYNMRVYDSALKYSQKASKISWSANDSLKLVSDLISQYRIQYRLKNKNEAFRILDSLISIKDQLTSDQLRLIYGNYGMYEFYAGNFENAITYYSKGIRAGKDNNDTPTTAQLRRLASGYANLAEACIELKQYDKAQAYLDTIQDIGFNNISEQDQKFVLKYQIRLSAETKENMAPTIQLIDSLFEFKEDAYKTKLNDELFALTKSYEAQQKLTEEKQQADIENLTLQNRLLFVLFGSLILVLIGSLFYRYRKIRFERQALQMQQRLLRSQMNPHFTFNTLYAIQNTLQKNPKEATDYLMNFSRLLRSILENSTQNYVALEKELNTLRRYLELQQFRTKNAFEYSIQLDGIEDEDLLFIPPMLLQPFVENSIEHGFQGLTHTGLIEIILKLNGKFIDCTIKDNGIGLNEGATEKSKSRSIQLISNFLKKVTKNDLEVLNRSNLDPATSGIIIRFKIPYTLTEYD